MKIIKKLFAMAAVISVIGLLSFPVRISAGTSDDTQSVQTHVTDVKKSNSSSAYLTFTIAKKNTVTVPAFDGETPSIILHRNSPYFTKKEKSNTEAFETYHKLDELGRCGVCYANVCPELMPTEARGNIGSVKPTGWQSVKYDCVPDHYLYNRCHLIGYQLTAENANKKNLVTGTRYLNIDGMLDYENFVAEYVEETGNHVLYRVTPVFVKNELVCRGLVMEAYSVEDQGQGVCFCAFIYNNQPGIEIDYATGESWEEGKNPNSKNQSSTKKETTYILNKVTKKYHRADCKFAKKIKTENKKKYTGTKKWLKENGYTPCGTCKP